MDFDGTIFRHFALEFLTCVLRSKWESAAVLYSDCVASPPCMSEPYQEEIKAVLEQWEWYKVVSLRIVYYQFLKENLNKTDWNIFCERRISFSNEKTLNFFDFWSFFFILFLFQSESLKKQYSKICWQLSFFQRNWFVLFCKYVWPILASLGKP